MTHYEISLKGSNPSEVCKKPIHIYVDSGRNPYSYPFGFLNPSNPLYGDLDYFDMSLLIPAEKIHRIGVVFPQRYFSNDPKRVRLMAYFSNDEWYRLGYNQEVHNDAS